MPIVTITSITETLTPRQKAELITRVTDAVVAVEGEFVRDYTWVVIDEIDGANWGFAGHQVAAEAIAAAKATMG